MPFSRGLVSEVRAGHNGDLILLPSWVLQLVFTRYEVSPKFLDIFLDGDICCGVPNGVWAQGTFQADAR